MKHVIAGVGLVAIVVILVYLFIPEPEPYDTPINTDIELLRSQNEQLQEDLFNTAIAVDSLEYELSRRDTIEKAMKKELSAKTARLADSTAKINQLAREVLALKSNDSKDSLCDDLARQVLVLTAIYNEYSDLYYNLVAIKDSTEAALVAVNNSLADSKAAIQAAYNAVYDKYLALVADRSNDKSLRRQKLKTKVVGILGIIGTGAALLK